VKDFKELHPIQEKYDSIFFKGAKEKYGKEHADELNRIKKAKRLLHKLNVAQPINGKELKAESKRLLGVWAIICIVVETSANTVLRSPRFRRRLFSPPVHLLLRKSRKVTIIQPVFRQLAGTILP